MSKFSAQHYNALAKDIRETLDGIYASKQFNEQIDASPDTRLRDFTRIDVMVKFAFKLCKRFVEDNERFDPIKFLNACSPDVDLYPIGELWDE